MTTPSEKRKETIARRKAANDRIAASQARAKAIAAVGYCPECGSKLFKNNALTGWWQCGRYPCEEMRRVEFKGQPDCSFQCFTE